MATTSLKHAPAALESTFDELEPAADELPPQAVPAELLQGCLIVGAAGDELGEIEEIMIDICTGRVSHVVISSGDWFDSKSIVIPWQSLRYDSTGARFLLKKSEEQRVLAKIREEI